MQHLRTSCIVIRREPLKLKDRKDSVLDTTNGLWLLPSYNRPHLLKRFLEACKKTDTTTAGLILVDKQDPKKDDYSRLQYPEGWRLHLTDGRSMGDKIKEVTEQWINLDWVGVLNDDHIPETKDWDQIAISQITGTNIIGTNDGFRAPQKLAGASIFSGRIIRELGYLFPPGIDHWYFDDAWEYLGSRASCINIMMDVMVRHDHVLVHGKPDETHMLTNTTEARQKALEGFKKWQAECAERDAQKLIAMQPKTGIMFATPSHDGNCALAYALGLYDAGIALLQQNIYAEMARVVGSSLIPHARNSLVDMFMKSKCQKLLFIDSDQGFSRNDVFNLLNSSRRVIAGITPHKRFPINLNFDPLPEDKKYFKDLNNKSIEEFQVFVQEKSDKKGEIEVFKSGTGFMMIDRSVFDIIGSEIQDYQAFDNNDQVKHKDFFHMGPKDGLYRGEDWWFCDTLRKHNIPVFINSWALVSHHGQNVWGIQRTA